MTALLLTLSLAIMTVLIQRVPRAVPGSPVTKLSAIAPTLRDRLVCPGSTHTIAASYRLTKPAVIELLVYVTSKDGDTIYPNTMLSPTFRPRSRAGTIVQDSVWTVPDLAPGDYLRMTAITTRNQESEPSFLWIPFQIAPGCPPGGIR